jgi:hypothetical protein
MPPEQGARSADAGPIIRRCVHCGRRAYGGAEACKSRLCPRYGPIWAGDWRRVLFENLGALGEGQGGLGGCAVMLALTAPGATPVWDKETGEVICEGMPWDESHCAHRGPHKHSGKLGCRADVYKATQWNLTADERWSQLHRRAATAVRRKYGKDALVLLVRAKELQKRGLIHWHPVLLATTPVQRVAVKQYRNLLAEWAPLYGFGFVSQKLKPQSAKAAAAYLSSYFVVGKKEKAQLQESVTHPALRKGRLLWMTPRLTQRTGITMRELRFRRYVWMAQRQFAVLGGDWMVLARWLAEIDRERGRPLTGAELFELLGLDVLQKLAEAQFHAACGFVPATLRVVSP